MKLFCVGLGLKALALASPSVWLHVLCKAFLFQCVWTVVNMMMVVVVVVVVVVLAVVMMMNGDDDDDCKIQALDQTVHIVCKQYCILTFSLFILNITLVIK